MSLQAASLANSSSSLMARPAGHPPEGWASALNVIFAALVLAGLLLPSAPSLAQAPTPLPAASASVKPNGMRAPSLPSSPSWSELTPEQQQALAPLASNWETISEPQKRKWLEISKNYRSLTPERQAKLNSRMNEWVALSPQQRAQARLNFGKTRELSRQLTPEQKKAQWEAYQALSPEEKKKLAAKASPKPSGAAPAVKPVAPQKLAVLPADGSKPAPRSTPRPAPKITALPPAAPASAASSAASAPSTGASSTAP